MKTKFFYGWLIVISMFLALFMQGGGAFYSFGLFYNPLMNEFGWDTAQIALAMTVYLSVLALTAPLIGKITDKYGAKKLVLAGAFLGGISFFLLSRISSLWHLYALYFVIGWAFTGCGVIPANKVISSWFVKKMGLAVGIAMAGVSAGALILTSGCGMFMIAYGWRNTYVFLGAITWVLIIPFVYFFMKDTPEEIGLLPDGDGSETDYKNALKKENPGTEWTLGTAVKHPSFWLILVSFFSVFCSIGAIIQHEVSYLFDIGISRETASLALGITGGMGGVGKVVFGIIADKTTPKKASIISIIIQIIGILILMNINSPASLWIFAVIFGFSMGGQLSLQSLIVGQFYGLTAFGTILGFISLFVSAGIGVGPYLAGLMRNMSGDYLTVFYSCMAATVLSLICILLARQESESHTG